LTKKFNRNNIALNALKIKFIGRIHMQLILFKSLGFVAVIAAGYLLRSRGFFKDDDYKLITKLVLNFTLPAAILSRFGNFQREPILFLMAFLGFSWNIFLIFIGFLLTAGKKRNSRIFYMMNLAAYNIGSFSMPFIQSFLGSSAVIAACMFDTGNAVIASGGSYAITNAVVGAKNGEKFGIKEIVKRLLSTPSFVVYVLAFVLAVFNFKMPESMVSFLSTAANANAFLAMLMLGLTLKFDVPKDDIKEIATVLALRYALCTAAALAVYFIIPFPPLFKTVLVLLMFSPTSALVPAFTDLSGGNTTQSSLAGSISIIISVIIMSLLMVVLTA
jgi:predicted permease